MSEDKTDGPLVLGVETDAVSPNEIVARYLLYRADQYESASWQGLADAAGAIMSGEHIKAFMAGELDDPELAERVRKLAKLHK